MATETVPLEASSDSIEQPWWLRALVRAALALLAFGALSFAADRFTAFLMGGAANSRYSGWVWLTWAGATIVAGLLFGLATLLPFANVRFMPSRLVLAAVALLPVSQFGWLFLRSHGAGHLFWFDAAHIQFSLAALAGVAIASAFTDDPEPRATGWLRVLVRAVLVLLAFWALWFAMDRFAAFFTMAARMTSVATIATGPSFDYPVWLLAVGATVTAGLLFGLATWLPVAGVGFLPSRLLLAAAALLPVAHFWWAFLEGQAAGELPRRLYWFDLSVPVQFVMAALAGVAIASCFRTRRTELAS